MWQAATGVRAAEAPLPTPPVRAIAFSPNGSRLAAAGADGWGHIYETKGGRHLRRFEVGGDVLALCYHPHGKRLLTARKDLGPALGPGLTVQVWDAERTEEVDRKLFRIKEVSSVAFSLDAEHILTAAGDRDLVLWSLATGAELQRCHGHTARVRSLAVSPDGGRALSGGGELTAQLSPLDCTVRLWDLEKGKEIFGPDPLNAPVASVLFSPDGQVAAAGTEDRKVYLWRLPRLPGNDYPVGKPHRSCRLSLVQR
jgi:WD40 repeat protein